MANQNPILVLFGNLGGDPEVRPLPEQDVTRPVYDPELDQIVEKTFTRKARVFRTLSIAVKTKAMSEPRWIRCVDWTNQTEELRKGDRVKLTGFFQVRSYVKDGESRRVRQFVVRTANLERAKLPQAEAA